jgi:bifunctional non-homologous end joining protein LigD
MDPPEDPTREAMPRHIDPMLARLAAAPPAGPGYAFEVKWDGIRALCYASVGRIRLETRNRNDITAQYPEIRELGPALGTLEAVLDGEIVAFDAAGRPSFERLQKRMGLKGDTVIRRRAADIPATYVIFDLLFFDGHSTMALPYQDRRRLLEGLELAGPNWQTPRYYTGEGATFLEATRGQGLEGIVAKRLGSLYEPGKRTGAWLKIKNHLHQHFVVGGWNQREGTSQLAVGALFLGYYDEPGGGGAALHYAGRVGTGFTEEESARLARALRSVARTPSPFGFDAGAQQWVEPSMVVEVEFIEWTEEGVLRHPSYKGERPDLDPRDVVRETVGT